MNNNTQYLTKLSTFNYGHYSKKRSAEYALRTPETLFSEALQELMIKLGWKLTSVLSDIMEQPTSYAERWSSFNIERAAKITTRLQLLAKLGILYSLDEGIPTFTLAPAVGSEGNSVAEYLDHVRKELDWERKQILEYGHPSGDTFSSTSWGGRGLAQEGLESFKWWAEICEEIVRFLGGTD